MKATQLKKKVTWKTDLLNEVQIPAVDCFYKEFNKNKKLGVKNVMLASINEQIN